jgi:hypothetical protein
MHVRSGCRELNRSIVYQVVREELPNLLANDRAIEAERKQQKRNNEMREERLAARAARNRSTGFFAQTGVLCLTGIPRSSFIAGVVMAALTIISAVYIAVSIAIRGESLLVAFLLDSL